MSKYKNLAIFLFIVLVMSFIFLETPLGERMQDFVVDDFTATLGRLLRFNP